MSHHFEQTSLLGSEFALPIEFSGGGRANYAGGAVERVLKGFLEELGYRVRAQAEVGTSIYGTTLTADLLLPDLPLVVEVKWQDARGSADEKFPYLVANVRSAYPHPVAIVVDGGGARPAAVQWLKGQVDGRLLVGVFNLQEFISWMMRRGGKG